MTELSVNGRLITDMKVTELRDALGGYNLSKSGVKTALVARLTEYLHEQEAASAPEAVPEAEPAASPPAPEVQPPEPVAEPEPTMTADDNGDDEPIRRRVVATVAPQQRHDEADTDEKMDKKSVDEEPEEAQEVVKPEKVQSDNVELDYEEGVDEAAKAAAAKEEEPSKSTTVRKIEGFADVKKTDDVEMKEEEKEMNSDGLVRADPVEPPRKPVSEFLHIRCLRRPFTEKSLKAILSKHDPLDEEFFWMDLIKTNAIVKFITTEGATAARERLHNCIWPIMGGRSLRIDYANEELFHENKSGARQAHQQLPPRADGREEAIAQRKALQERIEARERERLEDRERHERHRRERSRSPLVVRVEPDVPVKSLDDLFTKTKASPAIYWSALDEAQIAERAAQREAGTLVIPPKLDHEEEPRSPRSNRYIGGRPDYQQRRETDYRGRGGRPYVYRGYN